MAFAATLPLRGVRSAATMVALSVRVRPSIASNPGAAAGAGASAGARGVRSGSAVMVVMGASAGSTEATARTGPFSRGRLLRRDLGAQNRQILEQLHDLGLESDVADEGHRLGQRAVR